MMFSSELWGLLLGVLLLYIFYKLFKHLLLPIIINSTTKEIEKNPKWITSKIGTTYGFSDIDFIIVQSPIGVTPRYRITKDNRYQLLLDEETTTNEIDNLIRLALIGKIRVKYGLFFPEKPLHWLSILCFMLDGGEIQVGDAKIEEKDKKPIDLSQNL